MKKHILTLLLLSTIFLSAGLEASALQTFSTSSIPSHGVINHKESDGITMTNVIFIHKLWSETEDYKFEELKNLKFNTICLGAGYWTYEGKIELHSWATVNDALQNFAERAKNYQINVQATIGFMGPWVEKYDLSKVDVNEPVKILTEYPALQGINNDMEKIADGDEVKYIELNNRMAELVKEKGKVFTMDSLVGPRWYPHLSDLKIDEVYYMMYGNHPMDENNFEYGMTTVLKNSGSPTVLLMIVGDIPFLGAQLRWIDDILRENPDLPKPVGYGLWDLQRLAETEKDAWRAWPTKG